MPNVVAMALGGSHARGTHGPGSDLDIGLYYHEAAPFLIEPIRQIAQAFSANGRPTVTDFYGWGPFVNGGAWIGNPVCRVDFLYRNLDQLARIVAASERGEWEHSFDQQPPFGFRSVTTLGEIFHCKPLFDTGDALGPLKARVATFPPALQARIVQDTLWCAEFSLHSAQDFARTGDVPNCVGCMTRIFHYLIHALFALNQIYFMNDKRAHAELERFSKRPDGFYARASAILAAPGVSAPALATSLDEMKVLFVETAAFAGGSYRPRFEMP